MVTARPVSSTRSPSTRTPTDPPRADSCRPTSSVRPSLAAQYGAEHGVRAAGHRILRHPDRGSEEPGHEVHPGQVGGGGDRSPRAAAAVASAAGSGAEVARPMPASTEPRPADQVPPRPTHRWGSAPERGASDPAGGSIGSRRLGRESPSSSGRRSTACRRSSTPAAGGEPDRRGDAVGRTGSARRPAWRARTDRPRPPG